MATSNTGALGAFIGTIGPVTGYMRNGKNVLRTSSSSVKNQRTPLQLAQREKIRICNQLTKHLRVQDFSMQPSCVWAYGTGFNRVTGVLMRRCLTEKN